MKKSLLVALFGILTYAAHEIHMHARKKKTPTFIEGKFVHPAPSQIM